MNDVGGYRDGNINALLHYGYLSFHKQSLFSLADSEHAIFAPPQLSIGEFHSGEQAVLAGAKYMSHSYKWGMNAVTCSCSSAVSISVGMPTVSDSGGTVVVHCHCGS